MARDSRVILSYGGPLALGSVRTPFLPVLGSITVLLQPYLLLAEYFLLAMGEHHVDLVRRLLWCGQPVRSLV